MLHSSGFTSGLTLELQSLSAKKCSVLVPDPQSACFGDHVLVNSDIFTTFFTPSTILNTPERGFCR